MADTKQDRELSEAAFHSKYGFRTGWGEAKEMVWSAMQDRTLNCDQTSVLRRLWDSMSSDELAQRCAVYVERIDQ